MSWIDCSWCEEPTEVPASDSYLCDECEAVVCWRCMDRHYEHGCVLCPACHERETELLARNKQDEEGNGS
jgi:hypothetical protein